MHLHSRSTLPGQPSLVDGSSDYTAMGALQLQLSHSLTPLPTTNPGPPVPTPLTVPSTDISRVSALVVHHSQMFLARGKLSTYRVVTLGTVRSPRT